MCGVRKCPGEPKFLHPYSINGSAITNRNNYKHEGVLISSDLIWGDHHDLVIPRAYKSLGILCRTYQNVSSIARKKILYLSLVRSQLMYCSPIWHPNLIKDILKLEKVQRRATKFIIRQYTSDYSSRGSDL